MSTDYLLSERVFFSKASVARNGRMEKRNPEPEAEPQTETEPEPAPEPEPKK